jgi:uncharacterized protein (TIGR02300 family)
VSKAEWGIKRICPSCGTRYYDMRKVPPVCPSCHAPFDPEALLRSRRARPMPVDDVKKPVERDDDNLDLEVEDELDEAEELTDAGAGDVDDALVEDESAEGGEEDDVLLEDADELDDGDDMGEVIDVEEGDDR